MSDLTERQKDQQWLEGQRYVNEVRATVHNRVREFYRREGQALFGDLMSGMAITTIDGEGNLVRVDPARYVGGHFHVGEEPPPLNPDVRATLRTV